MKTLCKEEGDHHQPNNLSQYATSAARNYIAGPNLVSESLEPLCQCHCACDDLRTSPKDCEDGIESRLPALPCEAMAAVETAAIATAAGGIGPVTSPCPAPLAETCSEHLRTEGPKRCRGLHDANDHCHLPSPLRHCMSLLRLPATAVPVALHGWHRAMLRLSRKSLAWTTP